jgi:glyoxylase-like metal-dependent hydrolase (beta-lactamase superfamily II)
MFGVVPKPLWERKLPADARNRVRLGLRPLLVRGVRTMLIDAGLGDKLDAKSADIFGLERERHLDHSLAAAGLGPEGIEIVLASHLHFDHAGGFTVRRPDGTGSGTRPPIRTSGRGPAISPRTSCRSRRRVSCSSSTTT